MAGNINKAILVGRLTRDPELRYTPSGASVASFSMAVNRVWTQNGEKKEQVSFFNFVSWGKQAETITEYVKKGHKFGVEGFLQQRTWEDQQGNKRSTVEIVVQSFEFLQPREGNEGGGTKQGPEPMKNGTPAKDQPTFDDIPPVDNPFDDESIPF